MPPKKRSRTLKTFLNEYDRYLAAIDPAIALLQGRDGSIANRICSRAFLPEGPRFSALDNYVDDEGGDPLAWAFGALGVQDRARHLATLFLNDLADVLREAVEHPLRIRPLRRNLGPEPGQLRPVSSRAGCASRPWSMTPWPA